MAKKKIKKSKYTDAQKKRAGEKLERSVWKYNKAKQAFDKAVTRYKKDNSKHIDHGKVYRLESAKWNYEKAQKYYKKIHGIKW
jgi:hypothetical protein